MNDLLHGCGLPNSLRWGDGRALADLSAYLQDPEPLLRVWAYLALETIRERLKERGHVGEQQEADVHRQIEDAHVGESLVAALDQLFTPAHVGLHPALKELEDLKWFHLARVTDLLLSQLKVSRLQTQEIAAWALAQLGDRRAVEPLIACLTQEQTIRARQRIMGALEPLLACLSQAMLAHNQGEAERAMWVLGQLGHTDALEPLIAALTSTWDGPHRPVGIAAIEALGKLKDTRAVEALCTQLHNPSQEMRLAAARALQQAGDARARDWTDGPLVR